jgi:hypothetical protein
LIYFETQPSGAMPRKPKSEERPFLDIAKTLLVDIFAEAKNNGENLSPDLALLRLRQQIRAVLPNPEEVSVSARREMRRSWKSDIARQKRIHLYAVERYYKTYFPEASGRGRGRLLEEDRLDAAQMRDSGLTWSEVKEVMEPNQQAGSTPLVKHGKDKYRKRAKSEPAVQDSAQPPSNARGRPERK